MEKVEKIITLTGKSRGYSLVIGEHGTGKTSLIRLAVDSLEEPKGIAYASIPHMNDEDVDPAVVNAVRKALGWTSDPVIESGRHKWSSSFELVLPKANGSAAIPFPEVFEVFSNVALKYRQAHKVIPVLVANNANKLPESFLRRFQEYAKEAADNKIASIVFVISEGPIPRRMRGTSILSTAHR
jgi:MoxR-like ATPase